MAYMVRLAALYALADKRDEISVRDFDAALALVSYSVETVSFILPEAEIHEEASMAVRVESFIRDAGEDGVTSTEIYRHLSIKASELQAIMAELETIEVSKSKGGRGRPTMLYRYITPETADMDSEEIEETEEIEMATPVVIPADDLSVMDDFWTEEIDAPTVTSEPVVPAVVPILSDEEWAEIDAALSVTPEPEPVEQATAEPAVSKDAVMAYLSSPEGAELLQGILAGMMASAPQSAPEAPATKQAPKVRRTPEKAVTVGQAGTKVAPVPMVSFQAPMVEMVSAA
jgi:hypothetical protein